MAELIPVADVHPESNDRTVFDPAKLEALAASIEQIGLLQPITVRPRAEGGWWCIAGERRWRAHLLLRRQEILATVVDYDDEKAAIAMLTENESRVDLNEIDRARGYRSRMDRFGWTLDQVAAAAGRTTAFIRDRLALLELRPELQEIVATGGLFLSWATPLVGLDPNRQTLALRALRAKPDMDQHTWAALIGRLRDEQDAEAQMSLDADVLVIEEYVASATAKARRPVGKVHLANLLADVMEEAGEHLPMAMRAEIEMAVLPILDAKAVARRAAAHRAWGTMRDQRKDKLA